MNIHLNDLDVLTINNKTVVIKDKNNFIIELEKKEHIKLLLVDNNTYLIQILDKNAFKDIKLKTFIKEVEELL